MPMCPYAISSSKKFLFFNQNIIVNEVSIIKIDYLSYFNLIKLDIISSLTFLDS